MKGRDADNVRQRVECEMKLVNEDDVTSGDVVAGCKDEMLTMK